MTDFPPVPVYNNAAMFFRAQHAMPVVGILANKNAVEPTPATNGEFWVSASGASGAELYVSYSIGGSASNGVDYTTISNQVRLSSPDWAAQIVIEPRQDDLVEFDETVTLTLAASNTYLIDPSAASATITISDNFGTNIFVPVLNIYNPIAIDYHAPSNSLIVSYNYDPFTGPGTNFARVYTNASGTVVEPWSGIGGLVEEVKLATVKATANGFTNGDMYFGSDTAVGWLSADGTRSNLNWCILTNETFVNPLKIRGSLYVDRTGTFSNNLVVVTSDSGPMPGPKGVWLVNSNGQPKLLASINTPHLEGVITMTNDLDRWGPWAGRILTGDESAVDPANAPRPLIYAVDTNGALAPYALLGVYPEDFDIVRPDQDLYCVNFRSDGGRILKVSKALFKDCVGDLLITDAGEQPSGFVAKLALVRWNPDKQDFDVRTILLPDHSGDNHFEHVTFAPIDLPPLAP